MSPTRSMKHPPDVAPPIAAPSSAVSVAPSLPPAPAEGALRASTPPRRRPRNLNMDIRGVARRKVEAIIAMRASGYSMQQIGEELGIKRRSVSQYLYQARIATKQGLLRDTKTGKSLLADPMDQLEYGLIGKAVENMAEMLEGGPVPEILERGQKSTKMEATFKVAELALGPRLSATKEGAAPMLNALKIEIVMPSSGGNAPRESAVGGVPMNFIDVTPEPEES